MTSFLSSLDLKKDNEFSKLRVENKSLHDELIQCRADKEFVWSLWKRLQVANPDITQAVGMVVQREKEKSELKDKEILEILDNKDTKIDELQQLISEQSEELRSLITRKLEFEDRTSALEKENANLKYRLHNLEEGTKENGSREAVRELDRENLELKQILHKQTSDMERLKEDKADMGSMRETSRDRLKNLEEDLEEASKKYDKLKQKYDEMKKLLKKYETQLMSLQKDVSSKNKELEGVRKELSELWTTHQQTTDHASQQAELIRQLQDLQKDTQKMLQNTETAYSMETVAVHTENSSLKSSNQDMTRQLHQQSNTIGDLQDMISELQQQLEERWSRGTIRGGDYEEDYSDLDYRLHSLQQDVNSLKGSMSSSRTRNTSTSPSPAQRSRGKAKLRSRSLSPHRENDLRVLQRKLESTEKKLNEAHLLLHVKTKELNDVRTAHNRRLDRLKCMQSSHKLTKKQLALLEEEIHGPKHKKPRTKRSHPKALQKEDSDAVWNELNYFRKESKNLKVENVNLQEERDTLSVKLSQTEATNHELRTCLEQEREELQFMLEQERERSNNQDQEEEIARQQRQLEHYRRQVDKMKRQLDQVWQEQREMTETRDRGQHEKRALKSEINILRQQDSAHRVKIADFKKEISRLQRELKKASQKKTKSPSGKNKHYQQTLNRSIREMSEVFDGINKDGWEDVTDSENQLLENTGTSATTETAQSLGDAIVQQAQSSLRDGGESSFTSETTPAHSPRPTQGRYRQHREVDAEEAHYRRLSRREEAPHEVERRSVGLSPVRFDPPHMRSVGLSPIEFSSPSPPSAIRPHVVSKKAGLQSPANNSRLVTTLRQRVSTLQSQVVTLKQAKDNTTRHNAELKNLVEQLQSDVQSSNSKLQTHRLTIQRQHGELDKLRAEKEELEHKVHDQNTETTAAQHADQEFANIQTRLKNSANEVSKQLVQIKEYKSEISTLQEKILQLQDRVKSLERDNSQKRILVDDMKMKMKSVQDSVMSDAQVMEDTGQKVKSLTEINQRYKTQIESFKTRLSVVSKEKFDNEDKVTRLTQEMDKKTKQVSELQSKVRSLQSTVAVVEKTAKQQLTSLADQSEAAIDVAQSKLIEAGSNLQEYSKFLKVLSHSLVASLQQSRDFLNQQKVKQEQRGRGEEGGTLGRSCQSSRFTHVACDILNLSQSDLDDILSSDRPRTEKTQLMDCRNVEDLKKDKRWAKRWEKVLQTKDEFSVPLVELFMEKIEERCQVATEIALT